MSDRFTVGSRLRNYEVVFAEDAFASLLGRAESSFFLVDQLLLDLYGERFRPILPDKRTIVVEAIERQKTMDYCQRLAVDLIEAGIRRNSMLIAVGGGVVQDIAAFIASILYRGIAWVFYPTTLLAQADSCVGSKSSLNVGPYKNLLGTFYPPAEIVIDVNFIRTLPESEVKSGIGEILHFYLVDGSPRAAELMEQYEELLREPVRLVDHIRASLEIKKGTVEIDEFDQHQRNLFNYGHTFGHAIESVSDYRVPHGQAVTMGMDIANYLSYELGMLGSETFASMRRLLLKNLPDFTVEPARMDAYCRALARDKKNIDGDLTCILTSGAGHMEKVRLPFDQRLKGSLATYFQAQPVIGQ